MNCTSLMSTLESIDPNRTYQLWGLAYQVNTQDCGWMNMMGKLFKFRDFEQNLTNPLYQAQIMQQTVDAIFYPVCYAYSMFRIFMVCVVFVYVRQKLQEILINKGEVVERIESASERLNGSALSGESINHRQSYYRRVRMSEDKNFEIKFYQQLMYISMLLELICALRDFILFRGMLLYTNVMNEGQESCWINFYTDNFTCLEDTAISTTWRQFNYTRNYCNCLYHEPKEYFDPKIDEGSGSFMSFSIILWILSESATLGSVAFTIITLSRINRKEKAGWNFIKPTLQKSIVLVVFCTLFFSAVIYGFGMPIYYRFYNQNVILFYFFWKFTGFIVVFDRLYSKIWLEWKLRFQSLHSHGIEWNEHLFRLKRKVLKKYGEKINIVKQKIQDRVILEEVELFLESKYNQLKRIYETQVNKYYQNSIMPHIFRFEREAEAKLKTKWYDYLNYMLILNLLGIIGFAFLLLYSFSESNSTTLFWIGNIKIYKEILKQGFLFALVELIVFEISNVVFKLHCFFIELYKNIQLEDDINEDSDVRLDKSSD